MMISRRYWVVAAVFTLASSGMAQGTMKHGMMQGSMKHEMATGLRGVLRHMDAMHRVGMKMDGDADAAIMDMCRRMNTMLGELDKTLLVADQMHAPRATGSP